MSQGLNIISLFRLIRFKNLIIIALTQLFAYQFLFTCKCWQSAPPGIFWLFMLASVLIAAAANIQNDIFDIQVDRKNKPERVSLGKYISIRKAWIFYITFNLTALLLALLTKKTVLPLFFTAVILLLFLYNKYLKKTILLGNILVSLMLALSMYSLFLIADAGQSTEITFYVFFAFLGGLLREFIKDIEDAPGDKEMNYRTFPVVYGFRKSIVFSRFLVLLLCLVLLFFLSFLLYQGKYMYATGVLFLFLYLLYEIVRILFMRKITLLHSKTLVRKTKVLIFAGVVSMFLSCV
jgi:4-hydroxybenzoate polyprenyltransferase